MYPSDPQMLLLLYFVLPVWLIAGFADWLCHRATDIESTTGLKETYIHILMFLEMGLPLLSALFLDVNALVIAFMIVLFFCHEATALWDVSYAVTARRVSPVEQHIHSFLEMVPLMALLLVISRHWPQFLALFGSGDEPARFELKQRADPLPTGYIIAVLTGIFVMEVLPYLEEYRREKKPENVPAEAVVTRSQNNTSVTGDAYRAGFVTAGIADEPDAFLATQPAGYKGLSVRQIKGKGLCGRSACMQRSGP